MYEVLGQEFAQTLNEAPYKKAADLWKNLKGEEQLAAKSTFYAAANAAHEAKLQEIALAKKLQKEKEKKEKEYALAEANSHSDQ